MAFSIPKFSLLLPRHYPVHVIFTPDCSAFRVRRSCVVAAACALGFLVVVYLLWPSSPGLKISRLRLNYLKIRPPPGLLIDLSLSLTIKVKNHGVYSMDYRTVDVAVGYRGVGLGHVTARDGHLWPLGTSYVSADVDVDGAKVLRDVVPLLEDLLKGSILLDTVTTMEGRLGVFFFDFPIKTKISCELIVSTRNHTVACCDCRMD